jgi:hypothetical protein
MSQEKLAETKREAHWQCEFKALNKHGVKIQAVSAILILQLVILQLVILQPRWRRS